ncbi:hypothetical protein DEA8626_02057 [Defluviimonas aquaemixtae]|uniref:Glyoxalase-like domain-containing protein n=1 Tax=Albidovulum aquaemixtae TaxID=1542388 RepID=A0A2R8B7C5_9RHOB|nr:VOC family protein [Defluviimonas aquaemixtae]SPH18518.1 hypothetical protein DEA8626_02057 [Defluviimonas aquaemixtae]
MAEFDHLAVSARILDEGAADVEAALGVALETGGRHPLMGTHNRLLSLGPSEYLEVIAIDPDAPAPDRPRWFALDAFSGPPRLTNWVLRVDDLHAALAGAPEGAGWPIDLARGAYRWRMAVPEDGRLPFDNRFPALIEWRSHAHPAAALPDRGCRLLKLEVSHSEAGALGRALPLNDPRIDFVVGPPGLRAVIATPAGERVLT